MPDYGEDLVVHFLLNELRAEGMLDNIKGASGVYSGNNHDYVVTMTARKIDKTIRLSEN